MNLPRSGRPPKISPRAQRKIIQEVAKNPEITSKELQAILALSEVKVHESTIRKRLDLIKHRERVPKGKSLQKNKKINAHLLLDKLQEDAEVLEGNLVKTEVAEVEVFV